MSLLKTFFPLLLAALAACGGKPRVEVVKVDHISSLSASSQDPAFPPALILDGMPRAENAWHSSVRPSFPQWIQVGFPAPVRLRRFGIEAQFNAPGTSTDNLRRAPRDVEVWASDDPQFKTHQVLGTFHCSFERPGSWCMQLIAPSPTPQLYFRFLILTNGGDPDFVTVQEMKFFTEE